MRIAIGSDHAGFALKENILQKLLRDGQEVVDFGAHSEDSCDYPDFAVRVGREVAQGNFDRGVLVCMTGIGMSIAANKVPGIRAALACSPDAVVLAREHNDANVLALGAKFVAPELAGQMVDIFLNTDFQGGRHARRVAKIALSEQSQP